MERLALLHDLLNRRGIGGCSILERKLLFMERAFPPDRIRGHDNPKGERFEQKPTLTGDKEDPQKNPPHINLSKEQPLLHWIRKAEKWSALGNPNLGRRCSA